MNLHVQVDGRTQSMITAIALDDLARRIFHRSRCLARLAVMLLAGTAIPGQAQELGRVVQITGPSPFTNCTVDNVGGQPGTVYPETEIEPWIDSNPYDARNLIAG